MFGVGNALGIDTRFRFTIRMNFHWKCSLYDKISLHEVFFLISVLLSYDKDEISIMPVSLNLSVQLYIYDAYFFYILDST